MVRRSGSEKPLHMLFIAVLGLEVGSYVLYDVILRIWDI